MITSNIQHKTFKFPVGEMQVNLLLNTLEPINTDGVDVRFVFEKNEDIIELLLFCDAVKRTGRYLGQLECDALTKEDWNSLTRIALPILPLFSQVISVPRGGDAWAHVLRYFDVHGINRTLFVDDVWTTGKSMLARVEEARIHTPWHGLVLFARGPVPKNVTALFTTHERLQ